MTNVSISGTENDKIMQ